MNDAQITTRLPVHLVDRLDRLVPQLRGEPRLRAFGRITRSTALRMALERGVEGLGDDKKGLLKEGIRQSSTL